jgi:Family of unknown function (DUF6492)
MVNNRMHPEINRLSVVLPLALREPGVDPNSWRAPVALENHGRVYSMLATFLQMFRQADLHEFLFICPDHEIPAVQQLVSSLTLDPRYQVLPESGLCPDLANVRDPRTGQPSGWHIQQLLKLAVAARITTPFYLTLDSDILCCRPFHHGDLVRDGRALTGMETIDDYNRIYTPEFAREEMAVKAQRQIGSEQMLGWQRGPLRRHSSFSETPVLMHAGQVQQLTQHLEQRHQMPWQTALSQNIRLLWTEYTLYFGFLAMKEVLNSFCEVTDCNAVLNLEKSAWEPRSYYRNPRSYEVPRLFNSTGGPFVALQSWLPPTEWLPEGLTSTEDYYRQLLATVTATTLLSPANRA